MYVRKWVKNWITTTYNIVILKMNDVLKQVVEITNFI
jgi:hypothetical protein